MKEKKHNFTYKTTNNATGMYYLGRHSTDDIEDGYLGSGGEFKAALKKYGTINFSREILKHYDTLKDLIDGEAELITADKIKDQMCYNSVIGAMGGFESRHSVEARKKRSAKLKDKREIYKFSLNEEFICKFTSYREATKSVGRDHKKSKRILQAASHNNIVVKSAYGYKWSFERTLPDKSIDTSWKDRCAEAKTWRRDNGIRPIKLIHDNDQDTKEILIPA